MHNLSILMPVICYESKCILSHFYQVVFRHVNDKRNKSKEEKSQGARQSERLDKKMTGQNAFRLDLAKTLASICFYGYISFNLS